MESGDLITSEVRPVIKKRIVKKTPERMRTIKRLVGEHVDCYFDGWFKEVEMIKEFDKLLVEAEKDEDFVDVGSFNNFCDFVEKLFNDFDTGISFFADNECSLGTELNVDDFINLWICASKYYKEEFDVDVEMRNAEHAWNTIAYWVIKDILYDEYLMKFQKKYEQEYQDYKDEMTKPSRIPCGVCYENKLLYTGCYTCNNNYLCRTCYIKCENECPFCRDGMMISSENGLPRFDNQYPKNYFILTKEVLPDIPLAVENRVVETCRDCNKDLRWRDKKEVIKIEVDYAGDDKYIYVDKIVCKDCYNNWLYNEACAFGYCEEVLYNRGALKDWEYKWCCQECEKMKKEKYPFSDFQTLRRSIPLTLEFKEWVEKTIRFHSTIKNLKKTGERKSKKELMLAIEGGSRLNIMLYHELLNR